MMFDLTGKTVVVTGGGRGIGRGIARAMAMAGADIVISGRSLRPLEETATELRALGVHVVVAPGDIMSHRGIADLVTAALALKGRGRIDCWVNNAGSATPADVGPLIDMDEGQWDRVVDLNLKWTFFAAQAAARAMRDIGGSIVNISSRSGSQPCPMTGNYGAAKAGVESLTATMAVEWGHLNIRVNAIAPGPTQTEALQKTAGDYAQQMVAQLPLGRLGNPSDLVDTCLFLLSDGASWLTGQIINVDGGQITRP